METGRPFVHLLDGVGEEYGTRCGGGDREEEGSGWSSLRMWLIPWTVGSDRRRWVRNVQTLGEV